VTGKDVLPELMTGWPPTMRYSSAGIGPKGETKLGALRKTASVPRPVMCAFSRVPESARPIFYPGGVEEQLPKESRE